LHYRRKLDREADIDQIADAYGSTELAAPTLARTIGIALMQGKTG
jgi:hypothetical protein